MNRLTNSIAVLLTISYGGWLAVCGRLTVGFIYSAFTFSFQLAMGFSSLVTMTGARASRLQARASPCRVDRKALCRIMGFMCSTLSSQCWTSTSISA